MDILNNDVEYDINTEEEDEDNDRRNNDRYRGPKERTWDLYLYTIAMFFNHFAYVWLLLNKIVFY